MYGSAPADNDVAVPEDLRVAHERREQPPRVGVLTHEPRIPVPTIEAMTSHATSVWTGGAAALSKMLIRRPSS